MIVVWIFVGMLVSFGICENVDRVVNGVIVCGVNVSLLKLLIVVDVKMLVLWKLNMFWIVRLLVVF